MGDAFRHQAPRATTMTQGEQEALALARRSSCWCAAVRKRCPYHDGYADGWDDARDVGPILGAVGP